jgi:hypothetical protein
MNAVQIGLLSDKHPIWYHQAMKNTEISVYKTYSPYPLLIRPNQLYSRCILLYKKLMFSYMDLNHDPQSQNLMCYRYTIGKNQ